MSVRYIVDDVDRAIDFYVSRLGFREVMHPAPAFAMLVLGDLRLLLSAASDAPGGGGAGAGGERPVPGGWNRFGIEVDDLDALVVRLREAGVPFRTDLVEGVGGRQILVQDPAGNLVELFQPTREEARLERA